MKPNAVPAVGDVEERQDDWSFTVVDAAKKACICFVFKGRKEAMVSRRLMKEILARSIAMSVDDLPGGPELERDPFMAIRPQLSGEADSI